jgi:D-beta-D-heptose 7-phosphate kinase/D-beta-D-heptose 1-phosphate adenosyltransferase
MQFEIPAFDQARVLVVGDLMLDRYWSGSTCRVSPEAPVPVVHVNEIEERPGGAGNVALNVTALGAQCALLAVVGKDEAADRLRQLLKQSGVASELLEDEDSQTITKLRVLSQHQQLLRLDFEQTESTASRKPLLNKLRALLPAYDVVVFSDYGKGALVDIRDMIHACKLAGKPALVDPKGSDFDKYRRATVITPNAGEFQAVVGDCHTDEELDSKALQLADTLDIQAILITRGERGMSLVSTGREALHIPTEAKEVFDVTGAGDTVIATLASAMAAGCVLEYAVHLSNIAAGVTVAKLGSATVTVAELKRALHAQRGGHGVLDEDVLLHVVNEARENGETIVMTNGCFDILHAGHVHYLNQAAAMGDRLLVAVNIDETVRALKGEGRPVNNLQSRMTVLAGLAAVDWVVPFTEDTPERLICAVKPDLLVKGGDNDPDKVPGAKCVRDNGGEVLALDYIDGRSTTNIIRQIRQNE